MAITGFELKLKEWIGRISAGEEEKMLFQKGSNLRSIQMVGKCMVQMNDDTHSRESSAVGSSGK